ncbi:MAG: ATP-binding protein [Spirochaetes bacterium]|jgi:two-component system phosphate regulon sensor histidine kinase PhoR|nr:ATP-binding protein [Spirochaetota bacterium]
MDLKNNTAIKYTITRKIITAFTVLILCFVIFLLFIFHGLVKEAHVSIALEEMRDKTKFVENFLKAKYGTYNLSSEKLKNDINEIGEITGLRVTFIAHDGVVLADSEIEAPEEMDNHKYRVEIMDARKNGSGHSMRYSHSIRTDLFYYAQKYDAYFLRMAKPLIEMRTHLIRIRQTMLYTGALVLIISVLIVFYIVSSITRPINQTIEFASQFASGNFTKRITNYSNSEIGMIQRSLNNMADELVEKMNLQIFEQNRLKITIESIADGIAVINNEKKIIIVNKAFYSCINLSRISATGLLYFEVIRNRTLNIRIEQALLHGKPAHFEEEFINGRIYDVNINPISEEKTLQGVLIVLRNITEKKKIEKIKTDLVSNMSHELKTPITIIKGYLETIANSIEEPRLCSGFIQKAIENADRQAAIINDIIKLNMIETSNEFINEKVCIDDLLDGCISILEHKAEEKKVNLRPSLNSGKTSVVCNKFLAEEIFFNLIDNAINYNRIDGEVRIDSYVDENRQLKISITDSGVGIPPDSIDRIFERFYRVDKSRSRETGGTGLGLSIVKHAVSLLGWKIKVRSDEKGTAFTVIVYV